MRQIRLPGDLIAPLNQLAASATGCPPLGRGDRAAVAARCADADWVTEGPARQVDRWLSERGGPVTDQRRRAAVAGLALGFADGAPDFELPPSIRSLYGPAFRALVRNLQAGGAYGGDAFAKDIRLVLGLAAPAGAQDIDLAWRRDGVGVAGRLKRNGAALARLGLSGDIAGVRTLGAGGLLRPWLQIHTDERRLEEFHPQGWDQCYRRIADLLDRHPEYAGMAGLSWFYDPAVAAISPRLAYLQERPMANGAVQVRVGARPVDIERATRTSDTRRALHAAGRYHPRCWAIFWPREALLDWSACAGSLPDSLRSAA